MSSRSYPLCSLMKDLSLQVRLSYVLQDTLAHHMLRLQSMLMNTTLRYASALKQCGTIWYMTSLLFYHLPFSCTPPSPYHILSCLLSPLVTILSPYLTFPLTALTLHYIISYPHWPLPSIHLPAPHITSPLPFYTTPLHYHPHPSLLRPALLTSFFHPTPLSPLLSTTPLY